MSTTTAKNIDTNTLADQASQKADQAIKSSQLVANEALDEVAGGAKSLRERVSPMISRAGEQASDLAHRGLDAVRNGSHQLKEKAVHAQDSTTAYIRNEPVKAVLIAAATGAALMAVVGWLSRSRDH